MTPVLAQVAGIFTAPALAAAGAAAVGIPVAIHLLSRMRRKPQPWAAMRFLEMALRRQRNRLRVEQWLLLATRCLIMLVAGLALAGPVLGGCAGRLSGALDPGGRVLVLVIDDGLSASAQQVAGAGDATRLDAAKSQALALLDALSTDDRVAVWRASSPAGAVVGEPTSDHAAAREAIENLGARPAASDLPRALEQVTDALGEWGVARTRASVAVLSDFAAGADYTDRAPPAALEELGERARVLVTPPAPPVPNLQIAEAYARRRVVVTGDTGVDGAVAVPVEVRVRRFGAAETKAEAIVRVSAVDASGNVVGSVDRPVSWTAAQSVRSVTASVPVTLPAGGGGDPAAAVTALTLRAELLPGVLSDGLAMDNHRVAVAEVRRSLTVGLIDTAAANGEEWAPGVYLRVALSPGVAGDEGRLRWKDVSAELSPDAMAEQLRDLDAVFVAAPQAVESPAWAKLRAFADRGGILWVVAPPDVQGGMWVKPMRTAFGEGDAPLPWEIGTEAVDLADEGEPGRAVKDDTPVPEPLALLAADWQPLLEPVRVSKVLPTTTPADDAWITLAPGPSAEPAPAGGPDAAPATDQPLTLLAHRPVGEGHVLLLTTALNTNWTNLQVKPLLPSLVRDALLALRGGVGRSSSELVTGTAPALPGVAGALTLTAPLTGTDEPAEAVAIEVQPPAEGRPAQAKAAVTTPGVYASADGLTRLPINPPADAGDTRDTPQPQVAGWLDGLGEGAWSWLDPAAPAAALAQTAEDRTPVGWHLLWALLGLVLFETWLARWMSRSDARAAAGVPGVRAPAPAATGAAPPVTRKAA